MTRTVFVTGASGYIARHVVLELLRKGYAVRGSVRSPAKADHIRASMARHLGDAWNAERLDFAELDLTRDDGWAGAMAGADALIHTASPVPMRQPDDEDDVIRPAVDGTLRALTAAADAGIARVVLTSSVAAISGEVPQAPVVHMSEENWTDLTLPGLSPYAKSKTMAERAAWEFAENHPAIALTTINPVYVFGPALDDDFGASLSVIRRVLSGRDPMLPKVSFATVDVRDVAALHVAAMENDATAGQRIIAGSGELWLGEIAAILRAEFPDRRIARMRAPNWVIRLLALRDPALYFILPSLGRRTIYDTTRCRAVLGRDPIPPDEVVRAAGRFLVDEGHV